MKVTEVRKGMILVHDGTLHIVVDYEHIAPGNWRAINQLKLKNLKTNANVMLRLGSSENVEQAFQTLGTRIIEKAAKTRAEKAPTPS